MPADAGIRFGQYILLRRIARGGMAEVFLAQQRGLEGFDRRVAVKRILPHLADSPDFVKMFLGEAKLAAQLSHPNIVHIYEFGKVEQDYFIAMEFVDGVHAGQLFKLDGERLSPTLVARIGADAATALHYAHELRAATGKPYGLVHRDVSPANIMVSFDGIVKLCDFGIAKAAAAGDQLTNPGQVKGKYAYMSPEQTIAAQLDGRSDVFSLAIVMWELLTGRYIVQRGDAVEAMRAIRDGKLDPIEKVAPHVPPALAKAITWALQPKKEDRASAADFAQALEAFIKSSPELATAMQLGQFVRGRFTREETGAEPAIRPGVGTQVSPGTQVAQGTAVASSTQGALTVAAAHAKSHPWASDLDDETAQTLKKAEPPFAQKTMLEAPPREPVTEATEILDHNETFERPNAHRTPVPSGLAVVPTRISPAVPAPQSGPRPRVSASVLADSAASHPRMPHLETGSRPKSARRRPWIVGGVLGGLAVLSFVIALAASGSKKPAARDSGTTTAMTVVPLDAPTIDAPAPPPPVVDAAAPPVDAIAEGYLEVTTIPPGGKVRVGDQVRGSPARLVLTAGTHLVQADLSGYEPESRNVDLAASEHQKIEITFRTKKSRPVEHGVAMGKLSVRTTPYSNVFEGARELGQTPFADLEMTAGVHTLTFKNPSHETVTKTIKIGPGKSTKLSFSLP